MTTRMFIPLHLNGKNMNPNKDLMVGKWFKNVMVSIMEYFEVLKKSEVKIYVLSYNHLSGIWLNE